MKKFVLFLLIAVFSLFITGCNQRYEILSYDDLKDKIKNKDSFILEITRDGCSYCDDFTPKLREVADTRNIKIYNLNISNLSDEDKFDFFKEYNIMGTPTTLFFDNGEEKVQNRIEGSKPKEEINKYFMAAGY